MRKPREPKPEVLACRPFVDGFDTLVSAGVPPSAFSPRVLSTVTRARATQEFVSWDVFLDALDQGRQALGSDQRLIAAFERFEGGEPELIAVSGADLTPQGFVLAIFESYGAGSFPHMSNSHRQLPDGSIELGLWVPESFRDTTSFWLCCVGANRTLPCRAGFPPARVSYTLTPHRVEMRLEFDAPTRGAWKQEGPGRAQALAEVLRGMRQNLEHALERGTPPPTVKERIERLAGQWSLTPRQREVLGCISRGLSNLETASELGCARKTVELHVTELLRKAGMESRAQLLSRIAESA